MDYLRNLRNNLHKAFHIFIPKTIVYGYDWSRHGEVTIGKGTFINIRAYEKPYADYSGDYVDNPYMFDLVSRKRPRPTPPPVIEDIPEIEEEVEPEPIPESEVILINDYNPAASEAFKEIDDGMIYSKGPATIVEDIMGIIAKFDKTKPLDLVLAVDATGSMKDDIDELKARLEPEDSCICSYPHNHDRKEVRSGHLYFLQKHDEAPVQAGP